MTVSEVWFVIRGKGGLTFVVAVAAFGTVSAIRNLAEVDDSVFVGHVWMFGC